MHRLQPCQLGNDPLLNMVPTPSLDNAWSPLVNHSKFGVAPVIDVSEVHGGLVIGIFPVRSSTEGPDDGPVVALSASSPGSL